MGAFLEYENDPGRPITLVPLLEKKRRNRDRVINCDGEALGLGLGRTQFVVIKSNFVHDSVGI